MGAPGFPGFICNRHLFQPVEPGIERLDSVAVVRYRYFHGRVCVGHRSVYFCEVAVNGSMTDETRTALTAVDFGVPGLKETDDVADGAHVTQVGVFDDEVERVLNVENDLHHR